MIEKLDIRLGERVDFVVLFQKINETIDQVNAILQSLSHEMTDGRPEYQWQPSAPACRHNKTASDCELCSNVQGAD